MATTNNGGDGSHLPTRTKFFYGLTDMPIQVAATAVLMLAVFMVFLPATPVSAGYLMFWMIVFWLGWTMLFIPYYAWAAELSPDYHERSSITGWRAGLGLAASVISKLIPVVALLLCGFGGTPACAHAGTRAAGRSGVRCKTLEIAVNQQTSAHKARQFLRMLRKSLIDRLTPQIGF